MNRISVKACAVIAVTTVSFGCDSSDRQAADPVETEVHSAETEVPAPPETDSDVSLDFSLEPTTDPEAPWLLTVVATNHTDQSAEDNDQRILERWTSDGWEEVAIVPFDLASPGELLACEPGGPCDQEAAEALIPPQESGQSRAFKLRPLDDGTYRMTEKTNRGYTVDSNRITIAGAVVEQ